MLLADPILGKLGGDGNDDVYGPHCKKQICADVASNAACEEPGWDQARLSFVKKVQQMLCTVI